MPKEIITRPLVTRTVWPTEHDCATPEVFPCACNEVGVTRTWPALAVRWRRGGETMPDGADSAHVGITLTEYEPMPWAEYWQRHSTQTDEFLPPQADEHYSRTLTRAEINQLIATLRRARDAAYGRDE